MSAIANLVAFDGQSTPVSHTFVAESVAREKGTVTATYKEATAGVPDYAQGRVTIKRTKLGSGVNRVSTRVELPVMESISGQNSSGYTAAPKVAYVDTMEVVGFFHDRSVIANRRSVRQLAINIAGNVTTSVAAATTGPTPELFDQMIAPT
jgi:hypothetical protein